MDKEVTANAIYNDKPVLAVCVIKFKSSSVSFVVDQLLGLGICVCLLGLGIWVGLLGLGIWIGLLGLGLLLVV